MPKIHSEKNLRSAGFTLIEILIALSIIATLTAIAYPAYKSYIDKAMITLGISTLETVRRAMEEYNIANGNYPPAIDIATGQDGTGRIVIPPQLLSEFNSNLSSFESYVPATNNFTLTARARDRNRTLLVLTSGSVVTPGP